MLNRYEGWSEAELLILRKRVQAQNVSGQIIRSDIAGVRVDKNPLPSGNRTNVLKWIQYALWLIGEARAASESDYINGYANPWTSTVKRTRANYV